MCSARTGDAAREPADHRDHGQGYFTEMRSRLGKATNIAKAAEVRAVSGNIEKSIELALDIEESVNEVNNFVNAGSMINCLGKS